MLNGSRLTGNLLPDLISVAFQEWQRSMIALPVLFAAASESGLRDQYPSDSLTRISVTRSGAFSCARITHLPIMLGVPYAFRARASSSL